MSPALKGPTIQTVNPVGVGWSGGFRYPQVKTCGYSTLAPSGPNEERPILALMGTRPAPTS
jgi:hypothetical protein